MFTGIIQALGSVRSVTPTASGRQLVVELGDLRSRTFRIGDSIAVNGACLTAVAFSEGTFAADVSAETARVTTLGDLVPGSSVNLEPALTLSDPLGGHLVTGHVDGVGEVAERREEGGMAVLRFALPEALQRYAARKGSICIDGVSLTVNDVTNGLVLVTLVPHTLANTIMQHYRIGTRVNVEVDLVARYVERLLGNS
jgi:riboflavin synthase